MGARRAYFQDEEKRRTQGDQMSIIFKEDVNKEDLKKMTVPALAMFFYCHKIHRDMGIPMTVVSLISDRKGVKSVSRSHDDGRAFDIRIIDLNNMQKHKISEEMHNVFDRVCIGAFPLGTKNPKKTEIGSILVDKFHGTGPHFHFQVRPSGFVLEEYMDFCNYLLKLYRVEV